MSRERYVVRCRRDSSERTFSGWFAESRARRYLQWLDKHYACGPHRLYVETVAREHPHLVPVDLDYPGYVEVVISRKELSHVT